MHLKLILRRKDMSNEKLLNEATVRRFMKLAEIEPLAASFVTETYKEELEEMGSPGLQPVYQDDEPEGAPPELAPGEEVEMDLDLGAELETDEAPLDAAEDVEEGGVGELTLTDEEAEVFLKVADKVRAAMDEAPEPEDVDAPDMGDEELDLGAEEVPPEEMGAEEVGVEEEEELAEVVEDEKLVSEVASRVAQRLLTKNKK